MDFLKRSQFALLALFLLSFSVNAQNRVNPIKIEVEKNNNQEPIFYAVNSGFVPLTVSITFTDVRNSLPPSPTLWLKL